jgi:hypothetical protein
MEVETEYGFINIVTDTEIIEIKIEKLFRVSLDYNF